MSDLTPNPKKAAFVTLLGRPSSGKSTLVNLLCGDHVAIVSPVPQTTRNAIRGIVNREQGQLVLVDTPGVHQSDKKFNRRLTDTAFRSASESDLILYVLDATRAPGPEEEAIAKRCLASASDAASFDDAASLGPEGRLASFGDATLVAAVNKMDHSLADFNRAQTFLKEHFPELPDNRIIPISAQKNEGTEKLLLTLFDLAPSGDPFYPEDFSTDQEIDFRIAEIIRESAIHFLRQELPHSIYVEIADRELRGGANNGANNGADNNTDNNANNGGRRLWVRAFIMCERESQKGMIVGKGGKLIKAIGEISRKELNRIFDRKVDLDLRVKTGKDWRHNDRVLKKLLDG